MNKKNMKRIISGLLCAATIQAATIPAFAADNVITSTGETKSADVAVTATVESSYKVRLPMSIELKESADMGDFGPVFTSAKKGKVGVQGVLYGKYLNISVKDARTGSKTYDQENKLTLAKAKYDEKKGTYEVKNEDDAVSAVMKMEFSKFYPARYDVSGIDGATMIAENGNADGYTDYDFNICTTSKITADGPTLYYGKMTFFISTVDVNA